MIISDKYEWLEDINDPKVIDWAKKLNNSFKERYDFLSNNLYPKIIEIYKVPIISVMKLTNVGIYLIMREYDSYKVKLLDFNGNFKEILNSKSIGENVVIHNIYANSRGDRLAYVYSIGGSDESVVKILDMKSMEEIDELEGFIDSITWIDDERYYYIRAYRSMLTPDGVKPPATRIFLRENESDIMIDNIKPSSMHYINLKASSKGEKALITISYGWVGEEFIAGDLNKPETWNHIYGDLKTITTPIDYVDGKYVILYYNEINNGEIKAVWNEHVKTIVSEDKYPIIDAAVIDRNIFLHKLVEASSKIEIYGLNGEFKGKIDFHKPMSIRNLESNGEKLIFKTESYLIPYQIHMLTRNMHKILAFMEIEMDYEILDDETISTNETKIHMFIIKGRSKPLDKVLLYGYGGFRMSLTPSFTPMLKVLLEDNIAFVVANLRGGLEYGEKWHRDGMLHKKQNVFEDFKAVARKLKNQGSRIVIMGRSNGGLLVAATITQEPELVDGAVIGYPVIDMLKFHKLHPGVAKLWISEYGDPDNPTDREYLLKYSPYHNVKPNVKYPPTLIHTGLRDDRVHPAHALKFAAKLIDAGATVYLRLEEMSGHIGAAPEVRAREEADILAFIYEIFKST